MDGWNNAKKFIEIRATSRMIRDRRTKAQWRISTRKSFDLCSLRDANLATLRDFLGPPLLELPIVGEFHLEDRIFVIDSLLSHQNGLRLGDSTIQIYSDIALDGVV